MYDYLLQKGRFRPASMYVMYVTSQFHLRSIRYVEVGTLHIFLVRYAFLLFTSYFHCKHIS